MSVSTQISNDQNVIDSREVEERIEELEEMLQESMDEQGLNLELLVFAKMLSTLDHDISSEADEYISLVDLRDECGGLPDWEYGQTLIHEDHFTDYAMELAEDTGMVARDAGWPNRHIDWQAAAEELQNDYTTVNFAGATYWTRA